MGGGEGDKKRGGRWRGREGMIWEAFRERRNAMEPEEKDGRANNMCACDGIRTGWTKQGFGIMLAFTFLRRV